MHTQEAPPHEDKDEMYYLTNNHEMARPQHLYEYSLIYGLVTNRCVYYILFEPVLRIYALVTCVKFNGLCTHVIVCLEAHFFGTAVLIPD